MKRIAFLCLALVLTMSGFSQNTSNEIPADSTGMVQDSVIPWTGNLLGLNVYPAFGMIGGSVLPASKIFFQYRHMWEKTNLRFSVNYINYFEDNDRMDIVGVQDSSMTFREFTNNFYTLDVRVGVEHAYHMDNFRFYYGIGAIGGYHHFGKGYYQYERRFDGYPMEGVISPAEYTTLGWYRADMLKIGADLTLGVDILLSENVIMSVQYAPELAYYMMMSSERDDPGEVFVGDVEDYMDFRGDFVDIILSIGF